MNQIIQEVRKTIPHSLITSAADTLIERKSSIELAIDVLMPTCLYGLAIKASCRSFSHIFKTISHKRNLNFQYQLDYFLSEKEPSFGDPREVTKRMEKEIFGEKMDQVLDFVSVYADVKQGTSAALVNLVCPTMLSFLCKKIETENMGAADMSHFLQNQIAAIELILPGEIEHILTPETLFVEDAKPIPKACWLSFFGDFFKRGDN